MEFLKGRKVFITGAAYRLGKVMALAAAGAGADIILHHGHSHEEALETSQEIEALGRKCWIFQADLNGLTDTNRLLEEVFSLSPVFCLVNNASIFPPGNYMETTIDVWQKTVNVNLTAPFLLSQAFFRFHQKGMPGRIINLLDWRALRPGRDHFAYTICKSALASMTQAMALSAGPDISVNALALGAILPPSGKAENANLTAQIPMKRWAKLEEFEKAFLFLLEGPAYINGEIIHLDGGRHLV